MSEFQPLIFRREIHRMLADDVTGTQYGETDIAGLAAIGIRVAFSRFKVAILCLGDHFTDAQCSTGRRIHFIAMMGFGDIDVPVLIIQHFRDAAADFKKNVDTETGIGGKHDRDFLCRTMNPGGSINYEIGRASCRERV